MEVPAPAVQVPVAHQHVLMMPCEYAHAMLGSFLYHRYDMRMLI